MKIEDKLINAILLTFKEEKIESEFIHNYDMSNKIFCRLGMIFSLFGWSAFLIVNYLYFETHITYIINLMVLVFLFPLIILAIIMTYYQIFLKYYQFVVAFANLFAGIIVIYASIVNYENVIYLLPFICAIIFFAYFILRIRFKIALIITIIYPLIYLLLIIASPMIDPVDKVVIVANVSILLPCCVIGGYLLELSIRKIFIQRKIISEQKEEILREKDKSDKLLLNTLPKKIVEELKMKGSADPEEFENVTIYFSDFVGFTKLSSELEPKFLISQLNEIFTAFDDIMEKHGCERIKTIGDAYMAVCGMPEPHNDHADRMIRAASEMLEYLEKRNEIAEIKFVMRVGLHSGNVVGGIVGVKKYIYDVFGDSVNTASRMESNGEAGKINISEATYKILKDKYDFTSRKPLEVKGKGKMNMYFVNS